MTRSGNLLTAAIAVVAAVCPLTPAFAGGNLETLTHGASRITNVRWDSHAIPVSWMLNDQGVANNTNNGNSTPVLREQAAAALAAAFNTWQAVPTSSIAFSYEGLTPENEMGLDGQNVITWADAMISVTGAAGLSIVFALTEDLTVGPGTRDLNLDGHIDLSPTLYPDGTVLRAGTIIDADIAFNSDRYDWVASPLNSDHVIDIQAVATHEIGHFQGLSHSSLTDPNPTMFPFFPPTADAERALRSLEADDVASTSRLYPEPRFATSFGRIEGRVFLGSPDGTPADGVSVYAVDTATQKPVVEVISTSRLSDSGHIPGSFTIDGLAPGRYLVGLRYFDGADQRGISTNLYNWTVATSNVANGNASTTDGYGLGAPPRPQWANGFESTSDDLEDAVRFETHSNASMGGLALVVNTGDVPRPAGYRQLGLARFDSQTVLFNSGFAFSFYGTRYDRVCVGSNGCLTFGGRDPNSVQSLSTFLGPLPRIAGLYDSLNPAADGSIGSVDAYVHQSAEEFDVLYDCVPESANAPSNTWQIRLMRDGSITIEYHFLRSLDALVGISPGGSSPASHAMDFSAVLTYSGHRGEAIYEAFSGPLASPSHCVDLGACTLGFRPNGSGGYDVQLKRPGDETGGSLTVHDASPSTGPEAGGQTVFVHGNGFASDAVVTFGGSMATSFAVLSSGSIRCLTPPGTGVVDVAVSSGGASATLPSGYRYVARPEISSVAPSTGPEAGGTHVTIQGRHLTDVSQVSFGSAALQSVAVVDDGTITGVTAAGTGTVAVTVASVGGSATLSSAFTFVPPPVLISISPTNGPERGGNHVVLTGRNFTSTSDTRVFIGDHESTSLNVLSPTSIDAVVPAGRGNVAVRVQNPYGLAMLAHAYTYNPPPTLASVTPSNGPQAGGTAVTLRGSNFTRTADTQVLFGGNAAGSVSVVDPNTITCMTPAGAGVVDVVVRNSNGDGGLRSAFTYIPPPEITSVSPTSGSTLGGTPVTILGAHFSPAEATSVQFGGVAAGSVHVVDANTITCTTPAGTGTVDVAVTNSNGSATLSQAFTYSSPPALDCRSGNVNQFGPGGITDVLFVNGSAGGSGREIHVGRHDALQVRMAAVPGADHSRFVCYLWRGDPSDGTVSSQPFNLGEMCMPTPLNDSSPQPTAIFNNFGLYRMLGRPTMASTPAPSTLLDLPAGTRGRARFFMQGFIEDATSPRGVSVTNGIEIVTE